jgi:DNA polymerase-1
MVKGLGKNVALATFSDTADYSAIDANKTHLLKHKYAPKIKRDRLTGIFNLEMDLLEVLADMELEGAPVDIPALQVLYDRLAAEIEVAEARVFAAAGRAFNMNSNPEKQNLLYAPKAEGGQGLRPRGLTDTGKIAAEKGEPITIRHYSTDSDALEPYRGKNRLVDEMLAYTELDKLQSTYVIPYLGGEVTHTTGGKSKTTVKDSMLIKGRIHTDFVQYGAETGRMSSRHPNLQNVPNPKKSENGLLIRNLFIAPPGYSLVQADYSQIEPRIIASFSKDRALIHNYLTGGDVYVLVGDSMSVDRAAGKVLVLAISYGIGPDHIAKDIGCTSTAARDLMNRFNRNFPSIEAYKKQVIQEARLKSPVPYVTTLLGRRRYLPLLRSTDYKEKSGAERQCFNTKIQGTGADIIKLAMVRAHRLIPEGARMILTVHDEIVILTPNHLIDETSEDLREAMEGINVLSVPLTADIHVVTKWGDAK